MKETILQFFQQYPQGAIFISLFLNTLIAVLGLVPSFFLTAANILFFGFWKGTAISFLGEAIGALVSFSLYRKGFKKSATRSLEAVPRLKRLLFAGNKEAFLLVLSMRLLPFVPSGLITFAAAVGRIPLLHFFAASSLGKAPALLLEAYSVYQVTRFGWQGKLILALVGLGLIYWVVRRLFLSTKKQ